MLDNQRRPVVEQADLDVQGFGFSNWYSYSEYHTCELVEEVEGTNTAYHFYEFLSRQAVPISMLSLCYCLTGVLYHRR